MAVNPAVMAGFQQRCVDKTDAGALSPPKTMGVHEQGEQGVLHQFHKPVVTDRRWEIMPQNNTDIPLVIPFETSVAGKLE